MFSSLMTNNFWHFYGNNELLWCEIIQGIININKETILNFKLVKSVFVSLFVTEPVDYSLARKRNLDLDFTEVGISSKLISRDIEWKFGNLWDRTSQACHLLAWPSLKLIHLHSKREDLAVDTQYLSYDYIKICNNIRHFFGSSVC